MPHFQRAIGKRIRSLRESRGYSLEELAVMLDVDLEMMKQLEQGRMRLFVDNVSKVAIIFNVTTDYIIYGLEDKKEEPKENEPE
ncbi:MAG: helix-turn-helix transcriptional regulator [Lachnospiraceae bacterium]|nr:helix-turn-helix transcriptional regulator [Lachnospiraceae bacterium]